MHGLRAFPFVGRGRHRKPEPPARVVVVTADGQQTELPSDNALGRAMAEVARLLAHRSH